MHGGSTRKNNAGLGAGPGAQNPYRGRGVVWIQSDRIQTLTSLPDVAGPRCVPRDGPVVGGRSAIVDAGSDVDQGVQTSRDVRRIALVTLRE